MIHYHGLPITPDAAALAAITAGHAFVSWRTPDRLALAAEVAQSFAVDNGAFSAWRAGESVTDWTDYYTFIAEVIRLPSFDWCVIPDAIEGSEAENDALIEECPVAPFFAVPVWHMHESLDRLGRLIAAWPRVALGSSGKFALVGSSAWWARMSEAMGVACDSAGRPRSQLHGLRMLDPAIFTLLPLASADSTNIGRNVGIDCRWSGAYSPPSKAARATVLRQRIEAFNGALTWDPARLDVAHLGQAELAW